MATFYSLEHQGGQGARQTRCFPTFLLNVRCSPHPPPPLAAARPADSIMVDSWEAEQRQYTRTLFVLQRVQRELAAMFGVGQAPTPAEVGLGKGTPSLAGCPALLALGSG